MRLLIGRDPNGIIREIGRESYANHLGMLVTPRLRSFPNVAIAVGAPWAVDNDAYVNFQRVAFLKLLKSLKRFSPPLFVAAPDVVADAEATLRRFRLWQPVIHYLNYPVALVAQDGLEQLNIPWDDFDALFIGGTTTWKLSTSAARIAQEAKAREKHLHMGRVNSNQRIRYAQAIGCDSIDGSGYAKFSKATLPRAVTTLEHYQHNFMEGLLWDS